MTATETASAADTGDGTPIRAMTATLYDLILSIERHRVGLAHDLGLGTTDVAALWEIARHPGLRPGDLARALGLGVAGTSSVIDKLVKSGFARRDPDPTDRRSLNLALTPAGRHARAWIEEEVGTVVTHAFAHDPCATGSAELGERAALIALQRLASAFETVPSPKF